LDYLKILGMSLQPADPIQSRKLSTNTLVTVEIGIVEVVGRYRLRSARIDELAMIGVLQQSDVVPALPFAGDDDAGVADAEMAAVVDEQ